MEGKDSGPLRGGSEWARHLWTEVRGGAEHFQSWRGRLPSGRLRQFIHGLSLPFHIAREVWRAPDARRRYLRVGLAQALVAVVLSVAFMGSGKEAMEKAREEDTREAGLAAAARARARLDGKQRERQERIEQRARELQAALDKAGGKSRGQVPPGLDGGVGEALDVSRSLAALAMEVARAVGEESAGDGGVSLRLDLQDDEAEDADSEAAPEDSSESASDTKEEAPKEEAPTPAPAARRTPEWMREVLVLGTLEFWAALFAAMHIAQWVVIALSRDYHTALASEASLLTGVPPEDEPFEPRVRLNMPWLRAKLKRRWRAMLLFAMGMPAVALITLPLCFESHVFTALSSVWGFWWLTVFTAAKSARAWDDAAPRPPWFGRAWTWLTTHVPGFRWGLPRRYGALCTRMTGEVSAPAACVERLPWAFAGLALARFVGSVPPLKFFVRPLIPVASAHLLLAERAAPGGSGEPVPAVKGGNLD